MVETILDPMTILSTNLSGSSPCLWQGSSDPKDTAGGPGPGRALHRFAVAWVITTFVLVILGGTVTSRGAGLSVPDWPTTYGYPMFRVPWTMWIGRGGVFWEHAHRLLGSLVGLMTLVVVVWLWWSPNDRPWLRWLAIVTALLVVVQGIMGGLRVTEGSTALAIVHGVAAQLFLGATVWIAAATGSRWGGAVAGDHGNRSNRFSAGLRRLGLILVAVMIFQLILGASMRHTGARLAIPDFPSAYGQWVPPLTQVAIDAAIDDHPYEQFTQYYTPRQVGLHFAHRLWALAVLVVAVGFITKLSIQGGVDPRLRVPVIAVIGLLLFQLALGASVIWTGGSQVNHDVATLHQATGAALLATVILLVIRVHVFHQAADAIHDRLK